MTNKGQERAKIEQQQPRREMPRLVVVLRRQRELFLFSEEKALGFSIR
jgi:hypothetical protein